MTEDDDKLIKELFSCYKPELGSTDAFMDSLGRKLEKVEYIKEVQEAQIHRYRMAVMLSLVCGMAVGGIFSVFLMSTPVSVPLFTFTASNAILQAVGQHSRLIAAILLSGLASWGIVSVAQMAQEMPALRTRRNH